MILTDNYSASHLPETVKDFNELLENTQIKIDWLGRSLLVRKNGETLEIDILSKQFLKLEHFSNFDCSIEDKLAYYKLWGRIQQLYHESEILIQFSFMKRIINTIREFTPFHRTYNSRPKTILQEMTFDRRFAILKFSEIEFKERWPHLFPKACFHTKNSNNEIVNYLIADVDMVEEALIEAK